jgi:hypothetical protein
MPNRIKIARLLPEPLECREQEMFITMASFYRSRYPEIDLLFAIPNGGTRITREAVALKRQGVKSGVPDLCLPIARGGYHGWWGEMKRQRSGQLSPEQREWITRLRRDGHWAGWHRGAEEMLADLLWYLSLPGVAAEREGLPMRGRRRVEERC